MDIAAKYEVPHFSAFGATDEVNRKWNSDPDKYFYWVNKWWPSPPSLAPAYVDTIETAIANGDWAPEEKTAVIWGEDTDWGRSFGEGMIKSLEAAGWEILSEEYFPQEQTEFVPTLNEIKELDPALIAGTTVSVPFVSAFINQADQVGLESVIVADGLSWVGDWYENVGDSSDYILDAVQSVSLETEAGQNFVSTFETDYDMTPSPSSGGLAFDAANFFIQAAQMTYEEYGELSSETLAEFAKNEIQTGNWSYTDGIIMGEYLFTPDSVPDPYVAQGYYSFPIVQYFGGEGVKIYPADVAEQGFTPPQ
jgi:branched-chain amino acid transport system substrate-binding protein